MYANRLYKKFEWKYFPAGPTPMSCNLDQLKSELNPSLVQKKYHTKLVTKAQLYVQVDKEFGVVKNRTIRLCTQA